ncbi:hypothetical protein [Diaphorobacter caeni]|uniref:hypothetical protein n=1 Tax=Diaphorobacter caeni TaxID=2784387 RepID=UPI0018903B17|nr:hypothetical protein [Diaphorobacter caeni]MBF5006379.1 hypothetical protein [Diaphorobacter caeni]
MTSTKTIPLKAVSDALTMAILKLKRASVNSTGKPQARTAAFTDKPSSFGPTCANKRRRVPLQPLHAGFMDCGDLVRVVSRVHTEHGTREVRQIWGAGVRDLQADIGTGMLR